jgi:enamine deaminase RidA (YjgF/YER057c/UK114 family)
MTPRIVRTNPPELHRPPGYHHVTVVESSRCAFLAGQCPLDVSGAVAGGEDLDAQIDHRAAALGAT